MAQKRLKYNVETIGEFYANSANRVLTKLYQASGKVPLVKAPYGGDRTDAQQLIINRYQYISDHKISTGDGGRAIDHDNWFSTVSAIAARRGISIVAAQRVYESIWESEGWKNQQVNGLPFPTEPWHHAKHYRDAAFSGGSGTIIDNRKKGNRMGTLLDGPVVRGGASIFVVAGPGQWDCYSHSRSSELGSQYGSAVPVAFEGMVKKYNICIAPEDRTRIPILN